MTVPVVLRAEARMISASGMLPVSGVTPMSMPFASSATILLPLIVQLMLFPMLRITSISFPRIEDMASSYKTVLFFISMVTFLAGAVGAALLSEVLSAGFLPPLEELPLAGGLLPEGVVPLAGGLLPEGELPLVEVLLLVEEEPPEEELLPFVCPLLWLACGA